MGVRHDYASSTLFCGEDNTSVLNFDDDDENEQLGLDLEAVKSVFLEKRFDFDAVGDLLMHSEESMDVLVKKERDFLPRKDYFKRLINGELDVSFRSDAIYLICKVHAQYNFDPMSAYLSINYLDRFISDYELPKGKAWMSHLISVACLSLAAKLVETEVPLILDLQAGEGKYFFEAKTIQRMELLVLSTLKWRMHVVTPFSFIDYFLNKFNNGKFQMMSLVSRFMDLVLSAVRGISLLEFKPSEIAAAVALITLRETQVVEVEKALSSCIYVDKERVLKCIEVILELTQMKMSSQKDSNIPSPSSSLPRSPIGVLDAASFSYRSDNVTVSGSVPNSHNTSPAAKRRKLELA